MKKKTQWKMSLFWVKDLIAHIYLYLGRYHLPKGHQALIVSESVTIKRVQIAN